MSKIAVISCKKKKQSYPCVADEMYSTSFVYRAQRDFIKKSYDDYFIISSKYGIIHYSYLIHPYDVSLYKKPTINAKNTLQVNDENLFWHNVNLQLEILLERGCDIDFHTSNDYFTPLPNTIKSRITHVNQPKAFGLTQTIYNKAEEMHDNGDSLNQCLQYITQKHPSKYNEQTKDFWHPDLGHHRGKTSDLKRRFPDDVDEGTLYMLSTGRAKQHRGWVIDESLLNKLYKTESGQWRVKKS